MRDRLVLLIIVTALLGLVAPLPAAAGASAELPFRFNPVLDGKPEFVTDATSGTTWAAWAFRARGEFDIAVSTREAAGHWSEPAFLGRLDGLDQLSPAMLSDASGNLYLAFAVQQTAQVYLAVLPHGTNAWSEPILVTARGERGTAPALAIVGEYLVLAYRTADGQIALRGTPLLGSAVQANGSEAARITVRGLLPIDKPLQPDGIYDGPDGTDPLGMGTTTTGSGSGTSSGTGSGSRSGG